MRKPNLTTWLEMVWDALNEPNETRRDHLLHAAEMFLQEGNQESHSGLASLGRPETAA
jgi:hypothetical protein